jgi:phage terminase large subunit GpA-like protein
MLFGYLKVDEDAHPDEYFISFPSGLSEDYYKQLTAEVFDETKGVYLKRSGRRNEVIDLFVYCFAAAHHPRVRIDVMRDADWTRLEEVFEPRIRDLLSDAGSLPDEEVAPVEEITQAARQPVEELATESGWLDGYDINL